MKILNIDVLESIKMASGHLCLNLTDKLDWEDFPKYAKNIIKYLNGKILSKNDGPDIRIWKVNINNKEFRLTFEDYPVMVSLESLNDESDDEIIKIKELLLKAKKKV